MGRMLTDVGRMLTDVGVSPRILPDVGRKLTDVRRKLTDVGVSPRILTDVGRMFRDVGVVSPLTLTDVGVSKPQVSCAHRVAAGMHVTAGGFWCLMHSNTCCCWYAGAATTRFRVVCGLFWRVIYRRSLYNIDFIRRPCDRGLQEADVSRRVISSESTDGSSSVFAGTAGSVLDGCRGVDRA